MDSELSARDRTQLTQAARLTAKALSGAPKGFGLAVRAASTLRAKSAYSGGAWIQVATIRGLGSCEIWLDRYTGWSQPQFWYGLGIATAPTAYRVAKLGEVLLGEAVVTKVKDSGTHRPNDQYDRMKVPLPMDAFERPLLHLHGKNNNGYGLYLRQRLPYSFERLDRLAQRAAALFIGLAMENSGASSQAIDPSATPNRRLAAPAQGPWERHAKLMSARKRKDNFTCHICGINFEAVYGPIGKGYAQAHHVISLGSESLLATSLSDLVTVCANCHAMLGRAPDGPSGLKLIAAAFTGRWPPASRRLTTA